MESYISINPNFFNSGFIEFELEHPNEGSQDVDFTNAKNNAFYIHFKIVDIPQIYCIFKEKIEFKEIFFI